jgi:hypothetical protein
MTAASSHEATSHNLRIGSKDLYALGKYQLERGLVMVSRKDPVLPKRILRKLVEPVDVFEMIPMLRGSGPGQD